jgi:Fe2+ transport system protein FeoA
VKRLIQRIVQLFQEACHRKASAPKCDSAFCPAGIFALARLPCGVCVVVRSLELGAEAANRLRHIGIREGCKICLLNRSEPLLVSVDNARIALGTSLAEHIKVEPV